MSPKKSARSYQNRAVLSCLVLIVAGCAIYGGGDSWDELFGPAAPRARMVNAQSDDGRLFREDVQPLLEQRCVVCHGCYDAPCQLKLDAPEGIDRGASKDKVYDSARLREVPLTRLFEDATTTAQWRDKGFYPVLNEHEQNSAANLQASVMHHMLALKRDHPLPETPVLDEGVFDLGLDRKQQCPKPGEIAKFKENFPLWGMPYGLPGLSEGEFGTLEGWLEAGALMASPVPLDAAMGPLIAHWEAFLNGDSLQQQLMSRYLYEHWFLAHLYFDQNVDQAAGREFFRLVRSATPPDQPVQQIVTRRPYDDPQVERVYYRFQRDHGTVLDKTHIPYSLNDERMAWLGGLFLDADYSVEALPSFEPEVAANPFIAFKAIPVQSRWQFLLAEAQFTVMNFIKGPVCRGQIAVDVIRDNFWVFFENSQRTFPEQAITFLNSQEGNLRMPNQAGSNATILSTWKKYSRSQQAYLKAKSALMAEVYPGGKGVTLDVVWDGSGHNQNAALTVFRHFDNASVVKGLVGPEPKTAWLIDYPILERIHYLLVAGFDVFGNAGHQLTTRLYMDFLRMEAEFNFLALLPKETRIKESREWYQGASKKQQEYVYGSRANFDQPTSIDFQTDDPKHELYGMLKARLAPVLNRRFELGQSSVPAGHRESLERLASVQGTTIAMLPQIVILQVQGKDGSAHYYTVLHNSAHSNISSLFRESGTLAPQEDTLSVVAGFIGSYPNAFWRVDEDKLSQLVDAVAMLNGEESYAALMARYGGRRTSAQFWQHSDILLKSHLAADPLAHGLLDYNRLENR
jgi:hypothetical protein